MPDLTDERLAAVLASVADHLVVTPATGTATATPAVDAPTNGAEPGPHASASPEDPAGDRQPADDGYLGGSGGEAARSGDAVGPPRSAPADIVDRSGEASDPASEPHGHRLRAVGDDRDAGRRAGGGERRGTSVSRRGRRRPGAAAGGGGARPGRRGKVLVAAVVLLVATIGSLVVAPVREAVAGWLGIGSTGIERVPVGEGDPGDLPYLGDDLHPVTKPAAEARLGRPLPDTGGTELGPAPVLATPFEGGVVMAWSDGATTLWVQRTAQRADQAIDKLLTMDDGFERVDGLGDDAALVEGPHVLLTPERRLAAGTVVIWVDGDFEYRLESDLGVEEMLAVARGVRRR